MVLLYVQWSNKIPPCAVVVIRAGRVTEFYEYNGQYLCLWISKGVSQNVHLAL